MPVGHVQTGAYMPGKNGIFINKERIVFKGATGPGVVA